jgi:glycosyltransferase involved in cell wall biosynthesis
MHVALVTATPQTARAGSGTYVAGGVLAQALVSLGHSVTLLSPGRRRRGVPFTAHRFAFNAALDSRTVSKYDLVLGFDMDGFRVAGGRRPPFVAYILGMLADEARFERGITRWAMELQARAERWSAVHAAKVLAPSTYLRRRIRDVYGVAEERIAVVEPAFDLGRWSAALQHAPAGGDGILCVGHMYPRKDHATLVQAASHLRQAGIKARVTIVGNGPERAALARSIRGSDLQQAVHLTGHLDFATLVAHYAGCAIFCLPSRQEGFGLVLLEAMAAGKPVVACRGTAAEELIEDGINGILVPQGDPLALASVLQKLLSDTELRRRLGAAGRKKVTRFTPEAAANHLLAAVDGC